MSRTNTVLTIPHPKQVALKEMPYPKIVPGYVMVKVEIAPICIEHQVYKEHLMEWHSDCDHQGHEGVGTICEVTSDSKLKVGDRVVMYQGDPCGECFVCQRQLSPTHCLSIPYELLTETQEPNAILEALGGIEAQYVPGGLRAIESKCGSESGGFGFVQYRILQERMVQKIPASLPFRYAALANCAIGCTYTGVAECDVKKDEWVLVAGVGFIGFGTIINAKYRGANVIVLGRNDYRMEQARHMGADHIVNPDDPDWLEQIHALTGNLKGADHVFEASGYAYYQHKALAAVRRFGNVWLYGFLVENSEPLPIRLLDVIHNRGVHLSGNHDVHVKHREGLLHMLQNPEVQAWADQLITHEYNMSEASQAFEAALSKKAGKIFLYPHENCPESGPTHSTG
ncbi:MAG TPA: zinc-binding dehydrogenase [Gammaproteobacteria bacterium]|nr:zinc-binding dehydrogenase [Gammaproteobacteria bacterium]HAT28682.1 zinc-binding dehydrogenase [Gammaproteobacteria bacterium]